MPSPWRVKATGAVLECLRAALRIGGFFRDRASFPVRRVSNLLEILPLCGEARVVSLDVFDTLLYRTVEPPDFLKRRTANYAAQLLSGRGIPVSPELFLYVRNETEGRLRRQSQRNGLDPECNLTDVIFESLVHLLGSRIAACETEKLVRYEMEVECHHLRVASGAREALEALRTRGKRVILASDTYLAKEQLQQIFQQLGIAGYIDAVYASSEFRVGKYSGRLFHRILKTEGLDPGEMIHVGDTYESDVRGAVKAGVPSLWLSDAVRRRQRRRLARHADRVLRGKTALMSRTPGRQSNNGKNAGERELYVIGYDVLGPAFASFILHAVEECHRIGIRDVYYLAREGFLLRQIHNILTQQIQRLRQLPPLHYRYLYVSRLATSLPAVRDLGERELHLTLYRNRSANLAECLKAFGLDASEFSDLPVDFAASDERAKKSMFANPCFIERVQGRAQVERSRLRRYLSQEGVFQGRRVKAFIDIGWSGTIQANIARAFNDDPEFPMLVGFYFGRRYHHEDYLVYPRSIAMPGLFFDQKRRMPAEQAVGHCVELFELAASAPHGATLGYRQAGEHIEPIIGDLPTELTREQRLMQNGILDYAMSFTKAYNDYEPDVSVIRKQAADRLARFLLKPTYKQAAALSGLNHSIDWGSNASRPLIATDLNHFSIFQPGRLIASLRRSFWLEGSLRLSGIFGGLQVLAIVRRAMTVRKFFQRASRYLSTLFPSPKYETLDEPLKLRVSKKFQITSEEQQP